jgi:hypothetical protein
LFASGPGDGDETMLTQQRPDRVKVVSATDETVEARRKIAPHFPGRRQQWQNAVGLPVTGDTA